MTRFAYVTFASLLFTGLISQVQAAESDYEKICQVDADCIEYNAYYVCRPMTDSDDSMCVHKPLFPLTAKEWAGTFIFTIVMMLSKVAGIGGGGIAIPIISYFFNFGLKPATAISSFSILIASLAYFAYNYNLKNPDKPQMPAIDYGLAVVMMPLTLLGSLIGAYFYISFPEMILLIILTLLLIFLTFNSWTKGLEIYAKESEQIAAEEAQNNENVPKDVELAKMPTPLKSEHMNSELSVPKSVDIEKLD